MDVVNGTLEGPFPCPFAISLPFAICDLPFAMLPIQQLTPSVLSEIIRRQPQSEGRTRVAWQIAVGAALARATTVRLADGVLIVSAPDARWVTEIKAARDIVLRRLQHLLGPETVTRIRVESPTGPSAGRT
jgi:predicted nucleic acid-binding Zn ribbon protein